jgi:hypothetical protein
MRTIVSFLLAVTPAIISGQENLVPANEIREEIAHTILFNIVRDGPPPRWDQDTRRGWLMERGFRYDDADKIIRLATEFYETQRALEKQIMSLGRDPSSASREALTAERLRLDEEILRAARRTAEKVLTELRPEGRERFPDLIREIKAGTKMRRPQ